MVNGFGVMDLIAGAEGNLLGWVVATGGDIDEVDACLLHELSEGDGLWEVPGGPEGFRGPSQWRRYGRREKMLRPRGANGVDDFKGKATRLSKLPPYSSVR